MVFVKPKSTDSQGRLCLGKPLLELAGFHARQNEKIALCDGKDCILIRKLDDVTDCDILAIVTLDTKGRVYLPSSILDNFSAFVVKARNGKLIIDCFT